MRYLTLRWFTLSCFDEDKFKIFHSLEKAINKTYPKLFWYKQTENYLKQEFDLLVNKNNMNLNKLKNFDRNLQNFLRQNHVDDTMFLNNIDFMQQCDDIIYHKSHCLKTASDTITSLP